MQRFIVYVVTAECQRDAPITTSGGLMFDGVGPPQPIIDCHSPDEESHVWVVGVYDDEEAAHAAHEALKDSDARTPQAVHSLLWGANASSRAVQTDGVRWVTHGYAHLTDTARRKNFPERLRKRQVAQRIRQIAGLDWPPVEVYTHDLRHDLLTAEAGDVVLLDPPYRGTTGYHTRDLSRAYVVRLAQMSAARGARVGVCEGEAVTELLAVGWSASKIEGSSWRKPKSAKEEWLTTSFEAKPSEVQLSLYPHPDPPASKL